MTSRGIADEMEEVEEQLRAHAALVNAKTVHSLAAAITDAERFGEPGMLLRDELREARKKLPALERAERKAAKTAEAKAAEAVKPDVPTGPNDEHAKTPVEPPTCGGASVKPTQHEAAPAPQVVAVPSVQPMGMQREQLLGEWRCPKSSHDIAGLWLSGGTFVHDIHGGASTCYACLGPSCVHPTGKGMDTFLHTACIIGCCTFGNQQCGAACPFWIPVAQHYAWTEENGWAVHSPAACMSSWPGRIWR